MKYIPSESRYEKMKYNRSGRSGIMLPAVSLGLWHNFGYVDNYETCRQIVFKAFDMGITHFDLANNYGPPPGSAETNFGRIFHEDLKEYRDEIIISTKAGYYICLLYTSDAADEEDSVDLGGRRIIKKK